MIKGTINKQKTNFRYLFLGARTDLHIWKLEFIAQGIIQADIRLLIHLSFMNSFILPVKDTVIFINYSAYGLLDIIN